MLPPPVGIIRARPCRPRQRVIQPAVVVVLFQTSEAPAHEAHRRREPGLLGHSLPKFPHAFCLQRKKEQSSFLEIFCPSLRYGSVRFNQICTDPVGIVEVDWQLDFRIGGNHVSSTLLQNHFGVLFQQFVNI